MRKTPLTSLCLGSLLCGGVALADTASDDKLEGRIEARLQQSKLGNVEVDVDNGVATLKGDVSSEAQRARAARLARLRGVKSVTNELAIDPESVARAGDTAADRTEQKTERTGQNAERKSNQIEQNAERQTERIERNAEAKKEKLEERADRADRRMDRAGVRAEGAAAAGTRNDVIDPLVTAKVKTKILGEESLRRSEINVDTTNDGSVTLRGTVPSEAARARAVEIAKGTDGVRHVEDKLEVKSAR